MRAKVPPLSAIDWREDNHLLKFHRMLGSGEIALDEPRRAKLWEHGLDLSHNFFDVDLIVSRINEDWIKVNRIEELFKIPSREDRMWTDEEEKEYETLARAVDFLILDVRTLLIFIVVFMDALAKFLSWTIKAERQPKSSSFADFKKALAHYEGEDVQKLCDLIAERSAWFKEVKDLRDDFIIHHPAARVHVGFSNGYAHVQLSTSKGVQWFRRIPAKRINGYLSQLKDLLRNLNEFLCSRTIILPIESEYVKPVTGQPI